MACDASGEIAGLAVGASLWGLFNDAAEFGDPITKPGTVGSQYGYRNLQWMPGSPVFQKARASGLKVADWQNLILVNMLGKRFYDETAPQFSSNDYNSIRPYVQGSWRNVKSVRYDPANFLNAALAGFAETRPRSLRCKAQQRWPAASRSKDRRSRKYLVRQVRRHAPVRVPAIATRSLR